ncbi:hypothetical protein [Endozoicomonas sp. ONNA2]|nr:hypothetical protein [Endozoicomonas sp. ONNA2]
MPDHRNAGPSECRTTGMPDHRNAGPPVYGFGDQGARIGVSHIFLLAL